MSAVLSVTDLCISVQRSRRSIPVVEGVSFGLHAGRILGLVGESGCGKTVTALTIPRLLPERVMRVETGSVILAAHGSKPEIDVLQLRERDLRTVRGTRIGMIFQDPNASLDPAFTVGAHIAEAVRAHQPVSRSIAWRAAVDALGDVGIPDPQRRASEYPHQFSGGMRQRVMIAMALVCEPEVLLCDEPTTALDVTTQAQILELIADRCAERGLAALLVTHDLGVVAEVCHEVAVMYAGEVVEQLNSAQAMHHARHPYTQALLASLPRIDGDRDVQGIPGIVPQPGQWPRGCRFMDRCCAAQAGLCDVAHPELAEIATGATRCVLVEASRTGA